MSATDPEADLDRDIRILSSGHESSHQGVRFIEADLKTTAL
jgi:hypothetical protein